MKYQGMPLTYEGIILTHILNLSRLSTTIPSVQIADNGKVYHHTETDKLNTFVWGVEILQSMICKKKIDEEFPKEIEGLGKCPDNDEGRFKHYCKKLKIIINLLSRCGMLEEEVGCFTYDELDMKGAINGVQR